MKPLNFNFRTSTQRQHALTAAMVGFIVGLTMTNLKALFPLLAASFGIAVAIVLIFASAAWIARGDTE